MILVDSSVWIDFFRGKASPEVEWLDKNLGIEGFVVGDLILAEVLRGFKEDRGFREARRLLGRLEQLTLGGEELAVEAASNPKSGSYPVARSAGGGFGGPTTGAMRSLM